MDTSALTRDVTREEVRSFWSSFRGEASQKRRGARIALIALGAVVLPVGILAMLLGMAHEVSEGAPDASGQLIAMGVIVAAMLAAAVILAWVAMRLAARRRSRHDHFRLQSFAADNEAEYRPGVRDLAFPQPWVERGRLRSTDLIVFPTDGIAFANVEFTAGPALGRNTSFGGMVSIPLEVTLPNIRLESRKLHRTLPDGAASRDQRLSLEGDFDRRFRLLCPAGYERDALYLFPPDVMATIVDEVAEFDVELIDTWVILRSPADVVTLNVERWEYVAAAARAILSQVRQWHAWRDDRVPSNRLTEPGTVAPSGRRLKLGPDAGSILILTAVATLLGSWALVGALS